MKLKRPIVFFDLETTGVDRNKDRIVQIGAIKMFPDGQRETANVLVCPKVPIPKGATDVHGITDDMVAGKRTFYELADGLFNWFTRCDLGGYNIKAFDVPMLCAEFARCNLTLPLEGVCFVDPFVVFMKREKRKLTDALRFYCNQDMKNAHDALADITATVEIVEGQLDMYEDLPADPQGYHDTITDPNAVDITGKMKWKGEHIVLTFGKHKDIPLHKVDPGYLAWAGKNGVFDALAQKYASATMMGEVFTKEVK